MSQFKYEEKYANDIPDNERNLLRVDVTRDLYDINDDDGTHDKYEDRVRIFDVECCWTTFDSFNKEQYPLLFSGGSLVAAIVSILSVYYDVFSDIFLAEEYFRLQRWSAFGLTTAFTVIPLLAINGLNLYWLCRDYTREKHKTFRMTLLWFIKLFASFPLMSGSVVRIIQYVYHGWKSRTVTTDKKRTYHYRRMLNENADAGMLAMFEAFLESAPQLILQLSIILTETTNDGVLMRVVRIFAMVGSWISVSGSLFTYHKALRASQNNTNIKLNICGTLTYYLWRACELGPRILLFALFAAQFHFYLLLIIIPHWGIMSLWVISQRITYLHANTVDKILFDVVVGYLLIFCFQNVQKGRISFRAILYYCITFTENTAMFILWIYFTSHNGDVYYFTTIISVPTAMVTHIISEVKVITRRLESYDELDYAPSNQITKLNSGDDRGKDPFDQVTNGMIYNRQGENEDTNGPSPKKFNFKMAYSRQVENDAESIDKDDDAGRNIGVLDKLSKKSLTDCCGTQCWTTNSLQPFYFRGIDFLLTIISIIFFFYDVISDVILAEEYFRLGRWISFGFTAAFVFFPLVVMNAINISWYHRDYVKQKQQNSTNRKCLQWFSRVFFSLPLMCGPVARQIEYLYHGWNSRSVSKKNRDHHYHQMLFEIADAGMLKMFEAFLEAVPQLILQIFIILTESPDHGTIMEIVRPVAMVGSWIGASWALVSYQRALRASHNQKDRGLSFFGTVFIYLWRSFEVGPRIIILALCAVQFQYYMLLGVAVHWIVMSVWVACQKQEMNTKTVDKIVFDIVIGYVLIFCFQNVEEGRTRYRALLYYCITFSENLVMLAFWVHYTSHKGDWYYMAAIIVVPTGMMLQIIVQLLYYKCFHPNHKNIKIFFKYQSQ